MTSRSLAAYGTWASPISARRVADGVKPLSALRLDGATLWWLEGRPADGGRVVAVRATPGQAARAVTPSPFNVRSRVHEYGGGAFLPLGQTLLFSNFDDNLVYTQHGNAPPQPLTRDTRQRHADFEPDLRRGRVIAVREDHGTAGAEPRNSLVALALDGSHAGRTLAAGHDFYAAPRLSPDGRWLAWLCWNHPLMPWNGTELWLAGVGEDGALVGAHRAAGSASESIIQPAWSPAGALHALSDRSGWWNLYRVDGLALVPLCPRPAEFGRPMWQFGTATYGFTAAHEIVAIYIDQGLSRLARIDARSGALTAIETPFNDIDTLAIGPGFVALLAASPTRPSQVVRLDLASGGQAVLAQSTDDLPAAAELSLPQAISYASGKGRSAHAFHYAPANAAFAGVPGERPPLLVTSHGGPTSMSGCSLRLGVQFWTSRGFAVLDVNYGGSSGYGRAYRDALNGQWGIIDVEDCIAGARHLAALGLVDARRMAIRGASASGFTTLSALAFHDVFQAGASYFGVSDLAALDAETHKFESRYTQTLLAVPAERERVYRERSPALHADKINCPVIFFQGLDDKVVPPAQSENMAAALKARGVPVAYLAFAGEGHGFRQGPTLQRALEAELSFYAQVFGFTPADAIAPVAIQRG